MLEIERLRHKQGLVVVAFAAAVVILAFCLYDAGAVIGSDQAIQRATAW